MKGLSLKKKTGRSKLPRSGPVCLMCRRALPDMRNYFFWILSGLICMISTAATRQAAPATQNAIL